MTVDKQRKPEPAERTNNPITPKAACLTRSDHVAPKLVARTVALDLTAGMAPQQPVENNLGLRPVFALATESGADCVIGGFVIPGQRGPARFGS